MKHSLVAAAAALIVSIAAQARAQTTIVWAFTAVDAVQVNNNSTLTIRGVLSGELGPTDQIVFFYSTTTPQFESCQRLALLAMGKPGQYVLAVDVTRTGYPICKLSRAVP
jgi:hypothetical protein